MSVVPLKTKRLPPLEKELASTLLNKGTPVIFLHVSGYGSSLWNYLVTCLLGSWDPGVLNLGFFLTPRSRLGDFGRPPCPLSLLQPVLQSLLHFNLNGISPFEYRIALSHAAQPYLPLQCYYYLFFSLCPLKEELKTDLDFQVEVLTSDNTQSLLTKRAWGQQPWTRKPWEGSANGRQIGFLQAGAEEGGNRLLQMGVLTLIPALHGPAGGWRPGQLPQMLEN